MIFSMTKSNLSQGIRKFIRKEKARIRREIFDIEERDRLIKGLYQKIGMSYNKQSQ